MTRLRAILVDLTPLRTSPRLRWLYSGLLGIHLARQILVVAVPFQVFVLTDSSFLVGMVGLAQIPTTLAGAIFGGALADAFNRRHVLLVVQLGMAITSLGLAVNATWGNEVWPIFILMATNAGLAGIESPARTSLIPALVPRAQLAGAFALDQALSRTLAVVGPAVAGVLIGTLNVSAAYWLAAFGFAFTALALIGLGKHTGQVTGRLRGGVMEGWRYLRTRPLLQQVLLIDVSAMVFGLPRALFPEIGTDVLGGDASTVGLLFAAPGIGALAAAMTTGWISSVRRQGRAVVVAVSAFGLAIIGFGLAQNIVLAVACLAFAGAADLASVVFRNTILQASVPDVMRGRISGFKVALSSGGPRLGDAESGTVSALAGPQFAVVSGGVVTVLATILIAWRGRSIWRQAADDPPPATVDARSDEL